MLILTNGCFANKDTPTIAKQTTTTTSVMHLYLNLQHSLVFTSGALLVNFNSASLKGVEGGVEK